MEDNLDRREIAMTVVKYAAVAFLLLATFPGDYQPIETGLDGSYRYAVNELARSDHVFGRDGGVNHGPLGYLLIPLDIGDNLTRAVTLWLVVHMLFAASLLDAARRTPVIGVVEFTIVYIAAAALGLPYEYHLLIVMGLLMTSAFRSRWRPDAPAVAAGALAALAFLMKLTLGLAALLIIVAGVFTLWTRSDDRGRRAALASVAACLATSFILCSVLFDTRADLVTWIAISFEQVTGFGSAMSLSAHPSVLVGGIITLLAVLSAVVLLMRPEITVLETGVLLGPAMLLAFRDGFVRQDVHVVNFFPFVVAVLAVFLLGVCQVRSARIFRAVLVIAVFATVSSYTAVGISDPGGIARTASGLRGAGNIRDLAMIDDTRDELRRQGESNLAAARLPDRWVAGIREKGGAIGIFPGEISYAPANELSWDPNPLLQSRNAYTAGLDLRSAEQYGPIEAPAFVIADYKSLDTHHPLLDAPATTRELLRNYTLEGGDGEPARLLLRHVGSRFPAVLTPTLSESRNFEEWIDVPRSGRLLFAELDLRLTTRGRVSETVFRVSPITIEIVFADGSNETYRIVPDTARNGLLLNYLPTSIDDMAALFRGTALNRVEKFRIGGPGAPLFESGFVVTWREADYRVSHPRVAEN